MFKITWLRKHFQSVNFNSAWCTVWSQQNELVVTVYSVQCDLNISISNYADGCDSQSLQFFDILRIFLLVFWLVTGMASRSCCFWYECFLFKSSTGRFKYFINTSSYCKYQTLLGYFAFKDARALTFLLKCFELIVIAIILNLNL